MIDNRPAKHPAKPATGRSKEDGRSKDERKIVEISTGESLQDFEFKNFPVVEEKRERPVKNPAKFVSSSIMLVPIDDRGNSRGDPEPVPIQPF